MNKEKQHITLCSNKKSQPKKPQHKKWPDSSFQQGLVESWKKYFSISDSATKHQKQTSIVARLPCWKGLVTHSNDVSVVMTTWKTKMADHSRHVFVSTAGQREYWLGTWHLFGSFCADFCDFLNRIWSSSNRHLGSRSLDVG